MALTLEESIARVPFLAEGRDIKSTPLGGGITNLNYKIDAYGHSYVLRITGADTDYCIASGLVAKEAGIPAIASVATTPTIIAALHDACDRADGRLHR